ncbi:MAG: 2Fe-2S iron-sulfur cluster binding domain-containing protein [Proteobacteria bacterium]|nr:2Fe-2S iron-sulfur cluster binding domain-containing protein [Pseudomonadota bacterium]
MPTLYVTDWSGTEHAVAARAGGSVMEAIRRAEIDDLEALCRGSCSCATCHVYVEESWLARLPPAAAPEVELLAALDTRRDNSRLSCQINVSDDLGGLRVEIAPCAE